VADLPGPVGKELRRILQGPYPGLPQSEPVFTVRFVSPRDLNNVLKNATNIIFVATLDDQSLNGRILLQSFTQESIERINNDPNLFMYAKSDEFARGQEVLHLFGKNDGQLLINIQRNRDRLRNHFEKVEQRRLLEKLYNAKEVVGVSNRLLRENQYLIRVPFGYELAQVKENFVWLRQLDKRVDKTIFVYYQDYTSSAIFREDKILKFRNSITESHLKDIEYNSVYVTTQSVAAAPFETREINFNNKYAVETRGLWKLSDNSRGGTFLSYIFVDPELNRLYYIEGLVDSPGNDKRNFIREIEAILSTFKTASEFNAYNSDQSS